MSDIDKWLESEVWREGDYATWSHVNALVEHGHMSEEDRDLIRARASAIGASGGYGDAPSETDGAWENYLALKNKYPDLEEGSDSEDLAKPDGHGEGPKEGTDYVEESGLEYPGEKPPPVGDGPKPPNYGGKAEDGRQVVVSTEAIKRFIATLTELREMLEPAKGYVAEIDIKPGAFGAAYALRDRVMGEEGKDSPGIQSIVQSFLENTTLGMDHLEDDLAKVLKNYENAEELNKASAADVESLMLNSTDRLSASSGGGG